jgi:hypothetical protein
MLVTMSVANYGELHQVDDSMYILQKGTWKCIPENMILHQTIPNLHGGHVISYVLLQAMTRWTMVDLMEPFMIFERSQG